MNMIDGDEMKWNRLMNDDGGDQMWMATAKKSPGTKRRSSRVFLSSSLFLKAWHVPTLLLWYLPIYIHTHTHTQNTISSVCEREMCAKKEGALVESELNKVVFVD